MSRVVPVALPLSAGVYLVAALVFALLRGGDFMPSAGAVALVSLVTLGAAALFGALGARPGTARVALAGWMGVNLGLLLGGPLWGLGAALLTALLIRPRDFADRSFGLGLLLGFALAAAMLLAPRLSIRLPDLGGLGRNVLSVASLAAVLFAGRLLLRVPSSTAAALYAAGLLLVALSPLPARFSDAPLSFPGQAERDPSKRDVIVLVLDTVRADRLSLYGYERDTSPALERFVRAQPGTAVYPRAFSPATWTLPAHASLLSGLWPSEHKVHEQHVFDEQGILRIGELEADQTLAEVAREAGYRTGFVFANGWLESVRGMERGFDHFHQPQLVDEVVSLGEELRRRFAPGLFRTRPARAHQINRELLRFLDACAPGPCLAVANYMDAHAPYIPSDEHLGRFGDGEREPADRPHYGDSPEHLRHLSGLYDESVRTLDGELERLFAALEQRGRLRDAWLIVTSDHGEAFGEHGEVEHSSALYGEVTQIPLIIKPPVGERLQPVESAVDLLDVAHTVAAITGVRGFGRGRDLREPPPEPWQVFIEMFPNANKPERKLGSRAGHPGTAVAQGKLKLVDHNGKLELFDLGRDPREQRDVLSEVPQTTSESLRASLARRSQPSMKGAPHAHSPSPAALPLSREEENRLRALGYIE